MKPHVIFQSIVVIKIHLFLPYLRVVDDGHDDEEGGDEDEQGRHADEHLETTKERDILIAAYELGFDKNKSSCVTLWKTDMSRIALHWIEPH